MIKIFNANEKQFSSCGNICITPLKCIETKKKSLNGWYIDIEIPITYKEYIEQDKLCVIKTKSKLNPQAFRIKDIQETSERIIFKAHHVMFDAEDYFLLDVRPTELNAYNALEYINQRTDNSSPFALYSDIDLKSTAYFVRKNLLEAWEIIEERWGGSFDADNWNISLLQNVGNDNGESVIYGKNLEGIKIFEDWSSVCTKICPVGYDGLLLPGIYLKSKIQYEIPYTRKIEFQTELEEEEKTQENLLLELEKNAQEYLEKNQYPKISYEINSDINQNLDIGDKVYVKHPLANIVTEVQEYQFDNITGRIIQIIFGNYTRDIKQKFDSIKNNIDNIEDKLSNQEVIIKKQTELINTLYKKGYIYITENEILILDKLPKEEAKNVWRFNLGGLGFSENGYEGPFDIAITIDGSINAKFITTGKMSVERIEGLGEQLSIIVKDITQMEKTTIEIANKVKNGSRNYITNSDRECAINGNYIGKTASVHESYCSKEAKSILVKGNYTAFSIEIFIGSDIDFGIGTTNPWIGAEFKYIYNDNGTDKNYYMHARLMSEEVKQLLDITKYPRDTWVKFERIVQLGYTATAIQEAEISWYIRDMKGNIKLRHPKLEVGTIVTDWIPAVEDMKIVVEDGIDNLEIGGTNILEGTMTQDITKGNMVERAVTTEDFFKGCKVWKTNESWADIGFDISYYINKDKLKIGDEVTYSIYAKTDDTISRNVYFAKTKNNETGSDVILLENKFSKDFEQIWYTFTITEELATAAKNKSIIVRFECSTNTSTNKFIYWACPKLEKGSKATDYSPAPEDLITDIIEIRTQSSEIKATTESITNTITDITQQSNTITGDIENIRSEISEIRQTTEEVAYKFDKIGGNNLVQNSSGLFGNQNWEGLACGYTNTEIQDEFLSKSVFLLKQDENAAENTMMSQRLKVTNGMYYIGFKYKRLKPLANIVAKFNDLEIVLDQDEYTQEEKYIDVTTNYINISIETNASDAAYIGDLIIVKGAKQNWSPNPNEIASGNTKISGNGIEITSNTTKTKLLANADGVRIKNINNNETVAEFTDKGIETYEISSKSGKIGKISIQDINNQTWINRLN